MPKKISWIRLVYLYLMATVGLVVLVIGCVTIIQLLLKIYIFTNADSDYYAYNTPPALYLDSAKTTQQVEEVRDCGEKCAFSDSEKQLISAWLMDYQTWQQNQGSGKFDQRSASRERDAARAIAMILVGLPLWMYHWSVIKKDKKEQED